MWLPLRHSRLKWGNTVAPLPTRSKVKVGFGLGEVIVVKEDIMSAVEVINANPTEYLGNNKHRTIVDAALKKYGTPIHARNAEDVSEAAYVEKIARLERENIDHQRGDNFCSLRNNRLVIDRLRVGMALLFGSTEPKAVKAHRAARANILDQIEYPIALDEVYDPEDGECHYLGSEEQRVVQEILTDIDNAAIWRTSVSEDGLEYPDSRELVVGDHKYIVSTSGAQVECGPTEIRYLLRVVNKDVSVDSAREPNCDVAAKFPPIWLDDTEQVEVKIAQIKSDLAQSSAVAEAIHAMEGGL